jgi:hypothetical protein
MTLVEKYWTEFVVFVSGGGLAGVLTYWQNKRKDRTDEYQQVLTHYKELLLEIRESEKECKENIRTIAMELDDLKGKVLVLENVHNEIPFPMWLKSIDGTLISFNNQYYEVILKPLGITQREAIGKKDVELYGKENSINYALNDNIARKARNGYWIGKETLFHDGIDLKSGYITIKHVRYAGMTPIGVGVILLPSI